MKTYNKKLYRSEENKVIAGVMGGLGEYFDVDPVLFRVIYLLLTIFTAAIPGVLAYILMILIVPKQRVVREVNNH